MIYYAFYKPFGFLSQFTDQDGNHGLSRILKVEKDVYPVGRLDKDSEGLLILTNDKSITDKLLNPKHQHQRSYLVQVDREITDQAINQLKLGVEIKVGKSKYMTKPCEVKRIAAPSLPDREPPIRFRKNVPTSWIEIKLTEGKNRQVRKMCAAVGFPCLRLVRSHIENLSLENLKPGEFKTLSKPTLLQVLCLKN